MRQFCGTCKTASVHVMIVITCYSAEVHVTPAHVTLTIKMQLEFLAISKLFNPVNCTKVDAGYLRKYCKGTREHQSVPERTREHQRAAESTREHQSTTSTAGSKLDKTQAL